MKKLRLVLLSLLAAAICFAAVNAVAARGNHITPMKHSGDTAQLMHSISGSLHNLSYKYLMHDDVKSLQLTLYRLEGGEWVSFLRKGSNVTADGRGTLTLSYDDIGKAITLSTSNRDGGGRGDFSFDESLSREGLGKYEAQLQSRVKIPPEHEQLLCVQWFSPAPDSFVSREALGGKTMADYALELSQSGCTDAYAVTIMFSLAPLE